jgi:adenylate cyclase
MKNKIAALPGILKLRIGQHRLGALTGAAISIIIGILLLVLEQVVRGGSGLGAPLSVLSYDIPFNIRGACAVPQGAVIVYLDELSQQALQQRSDTRWNRSFRAELLDRLSDAGARAVIFDILFTDASDDKVADQNLAGAIKANGKVILAAEVGTSQTPGAGLQKGSTIFAPFLEASAGWGFVELAIQENNAVRQHFHSLSDQGPSLSWAAASLVGAPLTRDPANRFRPRWINYYGPPGTIPNVPFHLAIDPNGAPPGFFKDKVVFVGAKPSTGYTGTAKDEFKTPYTFWTGKFSPGVEIHATEFLNLLHGEWLTRLSPMAELSLMLCTGALFGFGLVLLRPLGAMITAGLAVVTIPYFAFWLVWHDFLWFSWLVIVVQIIAALLWSIVFNSVLWYVQKKLMMQTLAMHLSPARARVLMGRPELLRPGADLQTVSILFSDIANFSKISESMLPNDLAGLLNKYFESSISSIHKTEGTVVKLIGDAIFAIWNAPELQANHHERACRAALLLREQLLKFDAEHKNFPQLRTRVGLHTGVACVGNFGSSTRFDYTAIGDSINLSSRLEGLNKFVGTDILVTTEMLKPVEHLFQSRNVGRFQFKGFERAVEVHELIEIREPGSSPPLWQETFEKGLKSFQSGDFASAEMAFQETSGLRSNDGPSQFYLNQIADLRSHPPKPGWAGEVELKEK